MIILTILTVKLAIAKLKRHTNQSLRSVYYALVYPHLTYGCISWGDNYEAPLSQSVKQQSEAVRIINNVPPRDHSAPHYVDHITPHYVDHITLHYVDHITPHYVDHITPHYVDHITLHYVDHITPHYVDHITPHYVDHIIPHYVDLCLLKLPDIIKLRTCQLFYEICYFARLVILYNSPSSLALSFVSEIHELPLEVHLCST